MARDIEWPDMCYKQILRKVLLGRLRGKFSEIFVRRFVAWKWSYDEENMLSVAIVTCGDDCFYPARLLLSCIKSSVYACWWLLFSLHINALVSFPGKLLIILSKPQPSCYEFTLRCSIVQT